MAVRRIYPAEITGGGNGVQRCAALGAARAFPEAARPSLFFIRLFPSARRAGLSAVEVHMRTRRGVALFRITVYIRDLSAFCRISGVI
jgi:hypothetical protein